MYQCYIVKTQGELSERFKELVLKTSDSERNLGFESLTLRHMKHPLRSEPLAFGHQWVFCYILLRCNTFRACTYGFQIRQAE